MTGRCVMCQAVYTGAADRACPKCGSNFPQSAALEDDAILTAFANFIRRVEPDAWMDAAVNCEVEREADGVFVRFEDPSKQHRSYSPRIFAVSRREGAGGFHFKEA